MALLASTAAQRIALFETFLIAALCFYGLASVLYFRVFAEGLIPALSIGALLYFIGKAAQMRAVPGWQIRAPHALLASVVLLPALSLLGQSALNLSVVDLDGRSSINYVASFWGVGALWCLSGAAIAAAWVPPSRLGAGAILLGLLGLLWVATDGLLVVHYGRLSDGLGGVRFSHLNTSDYAVFVLALAYGLAVGWLRIVVVLAAVVVLFGLGGRTALICFITAAVGHQAFFVANSARARLLASLALVLVLVPAILTLAQSGAADLAGKDLLFTEGYSSDSSVLARLDHILLGGEDLFRQALFGDPSLIAKRFNSMGSYMHNLLSAWQFYGVVFFAVLLFSLFGCMRFAMGHARLFLDPVTVTFAVLLTYVVFAVLIGRAVNFYLLWLVLGFWLERWALCSSSRTMAFLDPSLDT